ncbi:MAG: glyoxalase superfamily protein [Phycicoccus sp.]
MSVTRALTMTHRDGLTMTITPQAAKAAAVTLRSDLAAQGISITHGAALELVAHQMGFTDWNTASAVGAAGTGQLGVPVPVLRVQRADDAREFYQGYLGFAVEWEHRFEPGLPLYLRMVRNGARLDLSEHHGDGTPGSVVWIPISDAKALRDELSSKRYGRARPAIDRGAPGGPTIEVVDPFGNVLRLCQTG